MNGFPAATVDEYINEIRLILLLPIARHCPDSWDLKSWIQHNMHASTRSVRWFQAYQGFDVPSMRILQGNIFRPVTRNHINNNHCFLVREDVTMPDRIDIEFERFTKRGGREWVVHRLTAIEWARLQRFCGPIGPEVKRRASKCW